MPRNSKVKPKEKIAYEAIRDSLDEHVKKLSQAEYKDVLEELQADIEGRLECVKEEMEDNDESGAEG